MSERTGQLREAGMTAWRTAVLLVATVVVLGYLLRTIQSMA
jgi:hypothetical protein